MIKIRLILSKTKWGKKMEKIIPKNILEFYTQILINNIKRNLL